MKIPIIQVLKSTHVFLKKDYTPESRAEWFKWPGLVWSASGLLREGNLKLPEGAFGSGIVREVDRGGLILLVDPKVPGAHTSTENGTKIFRQESRAVLFQEMGWSYRFEIFSVVKVEDGFDLYLEGERLTHKFGVPKRSLHKCGELKLGKPLRFRMNGMSDFSETDRLQRRFFEFDYVVSLIGYAESIQFVDAVDAEYWKETGNENWKVVDERKALY